VIFLSAGVPTFNSMHLLFVLCYYIRTICSFSISLYILISRIIIIIIIVIISLYLSGKISFLAFPSATPEHTVLFFSDYL
jgi:hypothetical protein